MYTLTVTHGRYSDVWTLARAGERCRVAVTLTTHFFLAVQRACRCAGLAKDPLPKPAANVAGPWKCVSGSRPA